MTLFIQSSYSTTELADMLDLSYSATSILLASDKYKTVAVAVNRYQYLNCIANWKLLYSRLERQAKLPRNSYKCKYLYAMTIVQEAIRILQGRRKSYAS